ncbi:MAG: Bax inhibitor-1/YccA family protein [Bacteroidetes bacterium]|nr:Bax inhibitor-1/YccA family protein [Bacteroidota bacterium]
MFNFNQNQNNDFSFANQESKSIVVPKTFIASVFSWMAIALGITAFIAYYFSTNDVFFASLYSADVTTGKVGMTGLGWVVMLAPLGMVLLMSLGFNKLSAQILTLLFVVYSFLMGMSLSFIFIVYTGGSIFLTFGVTAATFGVMAIAGYTTNIDLSKFGSIMYMALIGIIIASLVNMFMQSPMFDWIISIAGVLVFTGLTAWDVQKLKRIGAGIQFGSEPAKKLIIMGALTLYLDFINLFLFMLRFLGNRK